MFQNVGFKNFALYKAVYVLNIPKMLMELIILMLIFNSSSHNICDPGAQSSHK